MKAWNVYVNGEMIDTVFYNDDIDADEVKRGLIEHDNYAPEIEVKLETETGQEITDRAQRILESSEYAKIRYTLRSYLKNLSPKDQEMAGAQLKITIQNVLDDKE